MKRNDTAKKPLPSRKEVLLQDLTKGVQALLDSFESPGDGGRRTAHLVARNRLLAVKRFPLPDRFLPKDEIDLVVNLDPVPARPPVGFHIIEKGNLEIINEIRLRLGGHIFNASQGIYETHKFSGGIWICHHYADNTWRFNAKQPSKGDNVAKFLETFYARII